MAKRVIVSRQEVELTDEEAKKYILTDVFVEIGGRTRVENFYKLASERGIEGSKGEDLARLVNQLIKEGKLRIEYEYIHAGPGGGYFLLIKRIE